MIMIIITVMIMNVEYIWLTSLNEMQIKVSSAVAYDFNTESTFKMFGNLFNLV